MNKRVKEGLNLLDKLSKRDLFMGTMEYAFDNGYGDKIIELFNNYLEKGKNKDE